MPANLTYKYQKAEDACRRSRTVDERIGCLQDMLKLIPKHKGTEKLQAAIKTRLKESRAEQELLRSSKARQGPVTRFPRQGAGQLILLGAPNAGKSRVLAELTDAEPLVASYPFATRKPQPGMMNWEDTCLQLIDTPPTTDSRMDPALINLVRSADGVGLCFDGSSESGPEETAIVIEQLAARKTLLAANAGFDQDDFARIHVKTLLIVTRGRARDVETPLSMLWDRVGFRIPSQHVALDDAESVDALRMALFHLLDIVRVYTKRPGKPGEMRDPFTIPRQGTVEDLAGRVHREKAGQLKYARVWSAGSQTGRRVGKEHRLQDRDLVELHW
ncbi:MAG: GTPase [Planctomycetaceae bacterium]